MTCERNNDRTRMNNDKLNEKNNNNELKGRRFLKGSVDVSFPIKNDNKIHNNNRIDEAVAVYVIIDVTDICNMKLIYQNYLYYIRCCHLYC